MITQGMVTGGPSLSIPAHLSFGQYVIDRLRSFCETNKDCLINYETGNKVTSKEFLKDIVSIATGLRKLQLKRGNTIGIFSENRNEYLAVVLGAVCCGATVTTINAIYKPDELKHALSIANPTVMFCSQSTLKNNLRVLKATPSIKTIIQFDGTPTETGIIRYKKIKMDANIWEFEPADVQGSSDTLFLQYSSGTTGLSKAVMLTHLNVLYAVACFDYGYIRECCSRILIAMPWSHIYGLAVTIHLLTCNKLVVYLPKFSSDRYFDAIQKYKIEALYTVPPILVIISKLPIVSQWDLSSIKRISCGAAPLSAETTQSVLERLPNCTGIIQGYGMTELSLGAIKCTDDLNSVNKPGSCGRPVPGVKIKVVNIETREILGPYMEGEICIKGPLVMKGYAGNATATKEIMDNEGYLKTGDIGYYDDDGYFFIVDRLKELIKYKGNQVAPAAIESTLLQHSCVADCGVVGAPDEAAGELPTAFIVLKPNVKPNKEDILQFTEQKLSPVSRLRGGIIFTNEIPKNPSGKILRRVLKQRLSQIK
ncbi:4-coumarate--CoA ligase 1 [Manduca sexta]|uniref:4-coumarate--CoA ligase 1 n=1 Tax=Manduca sexta TaxID=7130 RepID=UPI00188FD071|nr:4-coumarate--CoA ligase 1 [Manduca sexta]